MQDRCGDADAIPHERIRTFFGGDVWYENAEAPDPLIHQAIVGSGALSLASRERK